MTQDRWPGQPREASGDPIDFIGKDRGGVRGGRENLALV